MAFLEGFLRKDEGITAIEYALIAALIAMAIIVGASLLGSNLNKTFSDIAPKVLY